MILVTGGAGFIGSNVLASLEAAGETGLVCCDRLGEDGKWRNIAGRDLAELLHPDELWPFLRTDGKAVETIVHMGAVSATTARDADRLKAENIDLTLALFDWCAHEGVRFIYASSAATYGDGSTGFDDDPSPEAMARLRPLNAYGWSKHHTDRRILRRVRAGDTVPPQWAGLKFFNVYGPNEWHKGAQQSVVPQFVSQIEEEGELRLFRSHRPDVADGEQCRDFLHVDDAVAVIRWLLANPSISGLFNVGTGQARSFLDLAHAVFAALERAPAIRFVDMPAEVAAQYQYFTEARIGRLRDAGYEAPFVPLEAGVSRYVRESLLADDPYR